MTIELMLESARCLVDSVPAKGQLLRPLPAAAGLGLAAAAFLYGLGVAGLVDFVRRNVLQATFALPRNLCQWVPPDSTGELRIRQSARRHMG